MHTTDPKKHERFSHQSFTRPITRTESSNVYTRSSLDETETIKLPFFTSLLHLQVLKVSKSYSVPCLPLFISFLFTNTPSEMASPSGSKNQDGDLSMKDPGKALSRDEELLLMHAALYHKAPLHVSCPC